MSRKQTEKMIREEVINREEFPEKVATHQEDVHIQDMQYLTIGVVVNAPYGRKNYKENESERL